MASNLGDIAWNKFPHLIIEWKVPSKDVDSTKCQQSGISFYIGCFPPDRIPKREPLGIEKGEHGTQAFLP